MSTRTAAIGAAATGVLAALTVLGALSAPAAAHEDARGAFAGRNGRVVFQWTRPGGSELDRTRLYLFYPDERRAVVLITPPSASHNANPAWSPNGKRIAFNSNDGGDNERDFDLFVVDEDGANLRRVTSGPRADVDPAWDPSGRRLVYASDATGDSEIWTVAVDGDPQPVRLTTSRGFDGEPAWSADGSTIAFTSARDGNQEIYAMNADGTVVRRLTTSAGADRHPSWSPDGTRLAFDSERAGNFEIYTMQGDGSDVRRLTTDPDVDARPAWSPAGLSIAFQSERRAPRGRQIWIVPATGGAPAQLSYGEWWATSPDWQAVQEKDPCSVRGTIYDDKSLVGSTRADVLCGLAGDDWLDASNGDDRLYGGSGADSLFTGDGDDRASGGPGNDRVLDTGGRDRLEGGPGNDFFAARDGRRDVVVGGPGRDSADVDRIDRVIGVEAVRTRSR